MRPRSCALSRKGLRRYRSHIRTFSIKTSSGSGDTPGGESGPLRSTRAAVLAYFVLLGVIEGLWIARIPGVKAGLHLTDRLLGASLLVGPAGLVAALPLDPAPGQASARPADGGRAFSRTVGLMDDKEILGHIDELIQTEHE